MPQLEDKNLQLKKEKYSFCFNMSDGMNTAFEIP